MSPCDLVVLAIEKIDWIREVSGPFPDALNDVYDLLQESLHEDACDSWPAYDFAERILNASWP